jgi:hypothetical protein
MVVSSWRHTRILREGDTLVVTRIERLDRCVRETPPRARGIALTTEQLMAALRLHVAHSYGISMRSGRLAPFGFALAHDDFQACALDAGRKALGIGRARFTRCWNLGN